MSEIDAFCRTCMHKFPNKPTGNKDFYNIFKTRELAVKLSRCSQLPVCATDEYPNLLCAKCYGMVLDFYDFQKMCADSLRAFKEILTIGFQENTEATLSSTVVQPPEKDTEDCRSVPTYSTQVDEYVLDETLNDDQLIEFSIDDTMFEDNADIEKILSYKMETSLPVKCITKSVQTKGAVLRAENRECNIKNTALKQTSLSTQKSSLNCDPLSISLKFVEKKKSLPVNCITKSVKAIGAVCTKKLLREENGECKIKNNAINQTALCTQKSSSNFDTITKSLKCEEDDICISNIDNNKVMFFSFYMKFLFCHIVCKLCIGQLVVCT